MLRSLEHALLLLFQFVDWARMAVWSFFLCFIPSFPLYFCSSFRLTLHLMVWSSSNDDTQLLASHAQPVEAGSAFPVGACGRVFSSGLLVTVMRTLPRCWDDIWGPAEVYILRSTQPLSPIFRANAVFGSLWPACFFVCWLNSMSPAFMLKPVWALQQTFESLSKSCLLLSVGPVTPKREGKYQVSHHCNQLVSQHLCSLLLLSFNTNGSDDETAFSRPNALLASPSPSLPSYPGQ